MKVSIFKFFLLFITFCFLNSCSSTSDSPKAVSSSVPSQNPSPDYTYTSNEDETLAIINSYRDSIGLNTLKKSNYISVQAEDHDEYMITNNVISHIDFDVRYENITTTLGAIKVGENIAFNYNSPEDALKAWLKSPLHKECIEGDYSHFGISIRVNSKGEKYYTNIFAKIIDKNTN